MVTPRPPAAAAGGYSDGATSDGLQQVVDALAARLGRSVAVDDTRGRLVTVSRHFGDEDRLRVYAVLQRVSDPRVLAHFRAHSIYDWTEPGRVSENPDLDFKRRVCCPARAHGILFGHLFLIDDGIEDREIELAAAAAAEIGLLMYRRLVLHEQVQARRDELARDLVSTSEARRAAARAALPVELQLDAASAAVAVVVVVEDVGSDSAAPDETATTLRSGLERAVRDRFAAESLVSVRGRGALVLLLGDAATGTNARAVAAEPVTGTGPAGRRVVAGVGPSLSGTDAAVRSYAGARTAAHAAALLPFLGTVLDEDSLGVYGVLLALPRHTLDEQMCPGALRRLAERDPAGTLTETLEAYLDCGGDATRTAAELAVHRSTLYYRLGRIESVSGTTLRDGHLRLALHLGVKLRRLLQAYREHPELDRENP
ncbi:MAG: helix-turn-helix domain-containing protein [Pseudonocardia sp.]|nr:helix-turn-helix domain-containing protein [Pseudonocardia sp.]